MSNLRVRRLFQVLLLHPRLFPLTTEWDANDVYAGKFLPTRRTPGVSTSELLERIVAGYRKREFDAKLEKIGASDLKAEGSDFDDSPGASRPSSRVGFQRRREGGQHERSGLSPTSAGAGAPSGEPMDTT